jgi:DNA mismatch repair protein MutS2
VRGGDLPPRVPIEYLAYMRPRDLEVLAFPQVLDAVAALALSTVGAEACRALRPLHDRAAAAEALAAQWSLFRIAETSGAIPLAPFPDVREALTLASHDGAILGGERLVEIRTVLRQARTARQFLAPKTAEHPALAHLPRRLEAFPEIEAALSRMLDDAGLLLDSASPLLAELRGRLRDMRQELETRLQRLVSRDTADERMADRYVTVRNNRFVVPMKAAAAPQIDGVVQDRSASGETLFVEPLFAIELNNRLLLTRKEEEAEELRLLSLLTAQIGAVRHEIGTTLAALAELDRLAAGAAFARRYGCTAPRIGDDVVDLRQARHPELLIAGRAVVPIDVRLGDVRRALVLTGPNTGGKSVALKTLGLLTAMAHAGLLVPADEGSTVPHVRAIYTDLGDEQSIERNLSTFSSHVVNLVDIFEHLEAPALVLLDEPGVGTDPDEGAALAIALIEHAIGSGALVAATTHYAPVKLYASNDPRIELAAVDVDPVRFAPRYRLVYGSLGESLGLAMARSLGLPASVLREAETRRSTSARELADAIGRLEASRRRHEQEHEAIVEERRALAELEREHARLVAELRERRRAQWSAELDEARAFVRQLKAEGRELLEVVRRRGPNAARTLGEFVREREEAIVARAADAREEAAPASGAPPAVGSEVEVRGSSIRGELAEITGDVARIRRGAVSFRVPLASVRAVGGTKGGPVTPARRHGASGAASGGSRYVDGLDDAPSEIRLIGLRAAEALEQLGRFLDRAQSLGLPSVRIVHGVGTGALKRAVAEYLGRTSYCTRFADADPAQGGVGVTVAELL